jgi:DNA-binding transcriptional LysR family regulator
MLEDINVFSVIAKNQSFSKAARELELSTPVVTRRLARLEKMLGTRLLNRTTRQVTLTEAGNLFYAEVNDILRALEASKESIKSLTRKVTGSLKVGLPFAFNQCYVSKALNKFLIEYPDLKIHIESGNNLLGLLNSGFDLVVHCGNLPDSNYHYKKLGRMKRIICASPAYLKEFGTPKTIEDLHTHNCLGTDMNSSNSRVYQENGKDKEILVNGNVNTNNAFDLKALAMNDVGIAYLSHYITKKPMECGALVPILDQYQKCQDIYAVYPSNKFMNKKTQVFLNFVIELITPLLV